MKCLFLAYQAALVGALVAAAVALFSPGWVDTADVDFATQPRRWDTVGLLLYCRYETMAFADRAVVVKQDRKCVFYDRGNNEVEFPSPAWRAAAITFAVGTIVLLAALLLMLLPEQFQLQHILTLVAFALLLAGVLVWANELASLGTIPAGASALCPGANHFDRGSCDLGYGAIAAFIAVALSLLGLIFGVSAGCIRSRQSKTTSEGQVTAIHASAPKNLLDKQLPVLRLDSDTEDGMMRYVKEQRLS